MALPRRSRGQTRTTRGVNDPPRRATGVSRVLACCVGAPVVSHRCFTLPRSSILCGCINFPCRQVNAVWDRYPTACTMYITKKLGVCWGLVDKISPAFELRNSGVPVPSSIEEVSGRQMGPDWPSEDSSPVNRLSPSSPVPPGQSPACRPSPPVGGSSTKSLPPSS